MSFRSCFPSSLPCDRTFRPHPSAGAAGGGWVRSGFCLPGAGVIRGMALALCLGLAMPAAAGSASPLDPVAENMLLLQTASGGWSKHYRGHAVDYRQPLDPADAALAGDPARPDDATIDNGATTTEIAYLARAYRATGNRAYLDAARRGVEYLLAAQYPGGGWPQFHPDRSGYRSHVTLNDDAMVNVITLLQQVAAGEDGLDALGPTLAQRAAEAATRGLDCLLRLQVVLDGAPTIWAAQYELRTLQPARARSYELPSLAVAESVGVLRLLMRQPRPDRRIVEAVEAGAAWLAAHRLPDLALERFEAASGPDARLVPQPGASLWARFYDLRDQQPLVVDRDGSVVPFARLSQERRAGYAWYGTWPRQLLEAELPRWRQRHGLAAPAPADRPAATSPRARDTRPERGTALHEDP